MTGSKTKWKQVLGLAAVSLIFHTTAWALDSSAFGLRGGFNATQKNEDFTQAELFSDISLPWAWGNASSWKLTWHLLAAAGEMTAAEETGFIGSAGLGINFTSPGDALEFEVGGRAAYLSRDRFGTQHFGGPVQAIGQIGIHYYFSRHLGIGYQIQHMSNGGLYSENNGLEMHLFELRYRF